MDNEVSRQTAEKFMEYMVTSNQIIEEKLKKIVLFLIVLCTVIITVNFSQKVKYDPVANSIDKAHHQIWSKFMDKENRLLYDYIDSAGTISIPTPEECKKSMPNALSWWVPNENGASFNGIYLDALCKKWELQKDNISVSEARKVAQGLKLLIFVGKEQGFLARGISTDGVSHFSASSPDQLYPGFCFSTFWPTTSI